MSNVLCLLLFFALIIGIYCCEEYGVGEVSDCADGFPTLFHIDRLAGNIGNLDTNDNDRRQVVIPDINFGCNGAITRWIVGAQWEGRNNNNMAFNTELQIWRKINPNQYMKVIGTSVFISGENASQVYEVETLLDFQEGDVLGFFQPRRSSIDILLEDSERLITYYTRPRNNNSPHTGEVFSIDDGDVFDSTRYPLIAVSTDPPDCGCGFMSVERLYALLGIPPLNGLRRDFSDQQVIFPSIRFRCTGEVVKWILAGRWNSYNGSLFPELQVWRSSGNSTFEKQGSSVISVSQQEGGGVYEFPVAPPLQFQPGDILGIIQPSGGDSRLQISYDDGGHSPNYATVSDDNNEFFNVQGEAVTTLINIPLVTVKIVEHTTCCGSTGNFQTFPPQTRSKNTMSTKTLSLSTAKITTPGGRSRQHSTSPTTAREPHSAIRITQTEPISSIRTTVLDSAKRGGSVSRGVFGVGVGVAAIIVVVIIATTALSVTVFLRRRSKKRLSNTTDSVAYNSASGQLSMTKSGTLAEKSEYVSTHQSHTPTISSGGVVNEDNRATLGEDMTQNVAYGYVGRNEVECNVAYNATATTTDSEDGVEYI